jgi:hypothetical protein
MPVDWMQKQAEVFEAWTGLDLSGPGAPQA